MIKLAFIAAALLFAAWVAAVVAAGHGMAFLPQFAVTMSTCVVFALGAMQLARAGRRGWAWAGASGCAAFPALQLAIHLANRTAAGHALLVAMLEPLAQLFAR